MKKDEKGKEGRRRYRPRRSPRICRLSREHDVLLTFDDGDVWIERWYATQAGATVYYYVSMKTGACRKLEPPTGAGATIYREEHGAGIPEILELGGGGLGDLLLGDEPRRERGPWRTMREVRRFALWPFSNDEIREMPFTQVSPQLQKGQRKRDLCEA